MNVIYIIVGIVVIWSGWGYFSSRVENTPYTLIEQRENYEIRLYPEHIVAQAVIPGSYKDSLDKGFSIVAGYIFGGNDKNESIKMTAPVVTTIEGELQTISFGMPRLYTLEALPAPTDTRVKIVTIPEKKMAVIRFGSIRTDTLMQTKKQELIDALKKDNISIIGESQYAGYNAPWTPPWMTRNEILIEVKD